jgi:hypothetical protein
MLQELIKEIPGEDEDGPHLIVKDVPANHAAFAMTDLGPDNTEEGDKPGYSFRKGRLPPNFIRF